MDRKNATDARRTHPLVDVYLARLHEAAAGLPAEQRAELVEVIREHIETALPSDALEAEAEVRNVLDRLGAPDEIATAAAEGTRETGPEAVRPPSRAGDGTGRPFAGLEIAALLVLGLGSIIAGLLGLLVGLALVWSSTLWTRREKLVATALPAALTLIPALVFTAQLIGWLPGSGGAGSPNQEFALMPDPAEMLWGGAFFLGPILGGAMAAIYLAVQGRRHPRNYS